MTVFERTDDLRAILTEKKKRGASIGFVPTMGALHEGHLRLIDRCVKENDICVSSIFINPLQFNNPEDFRLYPTTFEQDASLLEARGCHLLFHPSVQEMYPEAVNETYDFGGLTQVMEGLYRPGHFNGVAVIVRRLFDITEPKRAYFGEKDYQQLLVVKELARRHCPKVEIVACPTVREADGLAMSSRNLRLNQEQRTSSPLIYKTLKWASENPEHFSAEQLRQSCISKINQDPWLKTEYFEFSDACNLTPVESWKITQEVVACTAVFAGQVRLIDNIRFFPTFAE